MLFQVRCKHFIIVTLLARKNQTDAHQRHLTCFYFYLFKIAATTVCLDNFVLAAKKYLRAVYV